MKREVAKLSCHVLAHLTDDLRRPPWKGMKNDLAGHCYVASEALYHLLGGRMSGWRPMTVRHEGTVHWFLQRNDGEILDLTASQFKKRPPYRKARGRGFLTGEKPSKRALIIIALVRGSPSSKKH